mgnify:CR=1 FL=1
MNQQREEMQQQVIKSQMIFGGIAAVSLFVAAINIINTMTMAIYERTREIGVMKVLGCELGSIRTMFLLESSTIGFIGGLIGVAFSLLASFVLNNLSTILAAFGQGGGLDLSGLMGGGYYYMDGGGSAAISIIPPWLMLAALVFATLVGLVAGILPANKAVRISALEPSGTIKRLYAYSKEPRQSREKGSPRFFVAAPAPPRGGVQALVDGAVRREGS